MHKHPPLLREMAGQKRIPKLLANASVIGLLLVATSWSQETGSTGSVASVDQSFTALNQALSATANDLLASAQRPGLPPPSDRSLQSVSRRLFDLDSSVASEPAGNVHLRQAIERVQALRPAIEPILREEGIPREMSAVVLIESGGRTTALSPKGARGLWQIMPATARRYGLVVTNVVDERVDPYKSTRAAARYLHDLYTQFGDWPLALAAYNAGEDAVGRAIDRASRRDFTSIARAGLLPLETRNYVPAVLSAITFLNGTDGRYLTARAGKSAIDAVVYAVARTEQRETYE